MPFIDVFGGSTVQPSEVSFRSLSLTVNTNLEWPAGFDTINTVARIMEVTPSGPGLAVTMPEATEVSRGQDALFSNLGADSFEIKKHDGTTLTTVAAGESKYIFLRDNSTAAGTWGNVTFGTGTSSVDAASLVGSGIIAQGGALSQAHESTSVAVSFTIGASDRSLLYEATSGLTITLPQANTLSQGFFFMLRNTGDSTVTLARTGADTVDGQTSVGLAPSESCFVCALASKWVTVGRGRSTDFLVTQLTKSVAGGANVTLTSSEASNRILKFTGLLTANIEVYVPNVTAEYIVNNSTTGPFSLTIKTLAGTGVAVQQGNQYILYCDAVNVYSLPSVLPAGNILFATGSASAPSITFSVDPDTGFYSGGSGVIGITSNAIQVGEFTPTGFNPLGGLFLPLGSGSNTEAEIQWDSATDLLTVGTGAAFKTFVDTNSTQTLVGKTLTTPTLSNPSFSGITTNMGTVSTIDINGGTIDGTTIGATTRAAISCTTLDANGNVVLGDTSGDTLTINGTAVACPNGLNFDSNTLVIDAANNRVGVGVAAPAYLLHASASNATVYASSGASFSPVSATDAAITIANTSNTAGSATYLHFTTVNGSGSTNAAYIGSVSTASLFTPAVVFGQRTGAATYAEAMRISAGQRLLLGTTTDNGTDKLQVTGSALVTGAFTASGNVVLGAATTDTLNVGNGGIIKDASGNVGIGTSPEAGIRLHVKRDSTSTAYSVFENASTTGATANAGIQCRTYNGTTTTGTAYFFATANSWSSGGYGANSCIVAGLGAGGTNIFAEHASGIIRFFTGGNALANERARINSSGFFGINTTNPDGTLVLAAGTTGSASTGGYLGLTTGTNSSKTRGAGIEAFSSGTGNDHGLRFYTNAAASTPVEVMQLTSGARMLVGTNTDNGVDKLQVTGSALVTGAFTASGNVVLGAATTDTLNVGNGGIIKDASGNVGIGTSPEAGIRLHVKRDSTSTAYSVFENASTTGATANAGIQCRTYNGTTTTGTAYFFATANSWSSGGYGANSCIVAGLGAGGTNIFAEHASGIIRFFTGGNALANERARITQSGRTLFGTTTDNGVDLVQFAGSAIATGDIKSASRLFSASAVSGAWAASAAEGLVLHGHATTNVISTFLDSSTLQIGAGTTQKTGLIINGQTAAGGNYVSFRVGNAEVSRYASNALLLKTTASRAFVTGTGDLQIEGANTGAAASITRNTADTAEGLIIFGKSRGTAAGSNTAVLANDGLGAIVFHGADGTGMIRAAYVAAFVDGTPGTNDMPGRVVFATTADGSSTPAERKRITSDGVETCYQPAPSSQDTTATLTIAQLKTGIITTNPAGAVSLTLPTGTLVDGGFSTLPNDAAFEWVVINTNGTNAATILVGATHTIVGNATVSANTSACFRTRKTAANTFVTYRV